MQQFYYCQNCRQTYPENFKWIFWKGFRLHSTKCKGELIDKNKEILEQDQLLKLETKKIAQETRSEIIDKIVPTEDLDQYVFYQPKKVGIWDPLKGLYYQMNKFNPPTGDDFPTKKRNLEIATLLETGNYTLQEIGNRYGVSRERIRQICCKYLGKNYTLRRGKQEKQFNLKRKLEQELKRKTIKYNCGACSKPVTYGEAGGKHYYCISCHIKVFKYLKDPHITLFCQNNACQKSFHPYRNWKSLKSKPKYCSKECYFGTKITPKIVDLSLALDQWLYRQQYLRG